MKKNNTTLLTQAFLFLCISILSINCVLAQGQWTDDFSNNLYYNWSTPTSGATATLVSGKLHVAMALQSNGQYRGDIKKTQSITYYPGNYPIVAVKMSKPPKCNFTFDTPLGSFNNSSNNHKILYTSDGGKIYFWNLAAGTLGTTTLPTNSGTTLSFIQFKVANVELTTAQKAAGQTYYDISWVGTFASEAALRASVTLNYTPSSFAYTSGTFTHPGILHNTADLARIKSFVTTQFGQPYQSYLKMIASPRASSTYTMSGPYAIWSRVDPTKTGLENDCKAAYFNAHMWNITGNTAYRDKALQILNAYGSTSTATDGAPDAQLNGLSGFLLVNAAEIMRYTGSGWSSTNISQFGTMMQNVFYPIMQNFNPSAHGAWDAICMETLMGIAIFNNDTAMFNKVGRYALNGEGNGSYRWYMLSSGQAEESNRDQAHTQLALGSLCNVGEMAYKQGLQTLYSSFSEVLKHGFEYTAKYNNGNTVALTTHYDYCEVNLSDYVPDTISATSRGVYRPIYEMAYNHYVIRKNGTMPYSLIAKQNLGPEGETPYSDHPSFGTLFFYSGTNPAATSVTQSLVLQEAGNSANNPTARYSNGNIVIKGCRPNAQLGISLTNLSGKTLGIYHTQTDGSGNVQFATNQRLNVGVCIIRIQDGQKLSAAKLPITQ